MAKPRPRPTPAPLIPSRPAKVRKVTPRYGQASAEGVEALLTYYDQAVAHCRAPIFAAPAPAGLLLAGLPAGPVERATLVQERGQTAIAFVTEDSSGHRITVPSAFFVLRVLTLFESNGTTHIGRERSGWKNVPMLADGFSLIRLLANADDDEDVQLGADPADLCPWSLTVQPGRPRAKRDRQDAIGYALRYHQRHARDWGLEDHMTTAEYAIMLKGAFRLFDMEHGRHFLRSATTNPVLIPAPPSA